MLFSQIIPLQLKVQTTSSAFFSNYSKRVNKFQQLNLNINRASVAWISPDSSTAFTQYNTNGFLILQLPALKNIKWTSSNN